MQRFALKARASIYALSPLPRGTERAQLSKCSMTPKVGGGVLFPAISTISCCSLSILMTCFAPTIPPVFCSKQQREVGGGGAGPAGAASTRT